MVKVWRAGLLVLFLLPAFSRAQTTIAPVNDFCSNGSKPATTAGMLSSNFSLSIIPRCTVTVYLTGTTTKATIYSDDHQTVLSNPFTANLDGYWLFYAATNQTYDAVFSGGIPPNIYLAPRTVTYVLGGSGGGSGICEYFNGDTTSVNCGTNRVGDTAASPASVTSIGDGGLTNNALPEVVAIGSTPFDVANNGEQQATPPWNDFTGNVVAIGNNPFDVGELPVADLGNGSVFVPIPSDIVAIGDNPAKENYGSQIVAIGDANASHSYSGSFDEVAIGDHNDQYVDSAAPLIGIGNQDSVGTEDYPCKISDFIVIGNTNNNPCPTGAGLDTTHPSGSYAAVAIGLNNLLFPAGNTTYVNNVITVGYNNLNLKDFSPADMGGTWNGSGYDAPFQDLIAIGGSNQDYITSATDVVAIGHQAGWGGFGGKPVDIGQVVAIGAFAAEGLINSSSTIVSIGYSTGPGNVGIRSDGVSGSAGYGDSAGLVQSFDIVAIGDTANDNSTGQDNVVAIGTSPLARGSSSHDLIGIGYNALAENVTGNENIGIGDSAGGDMYATGVAHNTYGSENIFIGDSTGTCDTNQVSDTIILGDHACADASHQAVLGSAAHTTSTKLFGSVKETAGSSGIDTPLIVQHVLSCADGQEPGGCMSPDSGSQKVRVVGVAAGHQMLVIAYGASAGTAITSELGTAFTHAGQITGGGEVAIYYSASTLGGDDIITVGAGLSGMEVLELDRCTGIDVINGTSNSTPGHGWRGSASVTTTQANDMLLEFSGTNDQDGPWDGSGDSIQNFAGLRRLDRNSRLSSWNQSDAPANTYTQNFFVETEVATSVAGIVALKGEPYTVDPNADLHQWANSNGEVLARVAANGTMVAPLYQETLTTPASSTAACTAGQFTDDANYHYVCVATNSWKRAALSTF